MNESATILTSASAQAEDARQAGAESLNGNGFFWSSSREPATGRRPIPVREARGRNRQRRALCCGAGTFAVPCLNLVHLGQGTVHAYG